MYNLEVVKTVILKKGSDIGKTLNYDIREELDKTNVIIIKFKDKKKGFAVLSKTNMNCGVCDDCLCYFCNDKIIEYSICKVKED